MTNTRQRTGTLDVTVVWLATALPAAGLTMLVVGGHRPTATFVSALALWWLFLPLLVAAGQAVSGWLCAPRARRRAAVGSGSNEASCRICGRLGEAVTKVFRQAA